MTTHYVDLKVLPDPESGPAQLLGALYDHLHLALVQRRLDNIGVSFPAYSLSPRTLGAMLRLHGSETDLQELLATDWLKGMRDHVQSSQISPVPTGVLYRTVHRRQFKTNVERLRRRRMRRKGETEQEAADAIPQTAERQPNLPYVQLRSRSTGQAFCLFIALGETSEKASGSQFNSHGLSRTSTIPWF